jgi:putative NADH-flavin reductase
MQITVFGANGKVGRLVVETALAKDYQVVAFVHNKSNLPPHKNLRIYKGDVYNPGQVAGAIKGSEAALSALASWGTPKKDVLTVWAQQITQAATQHGLRRVISVTGADARDAGDADGLIHLLTHFAFGLIARRILADGEKHMQILRASNLEWTTVRSPVMNGKGGRYLLTLKRPKPWQTITRQSVAEAMIEQITSTDFIKQSPYIARSK